LSLVLRLERPLPESLPAGSSTAVFCVGVCFASEARIDDLEILVDGVRHRISAFGMPRPDVGAVGEPGHNSGFWGTVPVPARAAPGTIELQVAVRLEQGEEVIRPLGEIAVLARSSPPVTVARPARSGPGLIAVCMATFEPEMALFETQIASLRAQTDDRWICLISDDCSSLERFERVTQLIGDDQRFEISRSEDRLGFYRNFERALNMVPAGADLIALCDQDDRWHPEKLRGLRDAIGGAVLVYSDLRLVDADGVVLRETLWKGRANNHDNLASMLVANSITGAATLFRRDLMEIALPFPDTPGFQFHDHWLAVAALAWGEVAYVERPLYDYVQHPGAVFGDVTHGSRASASGLRGAISRLRGSRAPAASRAAYFYGYLAREVQAQVLLARCGDRLTTRKRRALVWFTVCDRSLSALAWLLGRSARYLVGRTETLGSEVEIGRGLLWKRLATAQSRRQGARRGPFTDASIPPPQSFTQKRLRRWRSRV
jgi:glycosyltransferase involved in cell wall biosynthesis